MGRSLNASEERRLHDRLPATAAQSRLAARLRTGSPLLVLDTSSDGMLVESPARLLPGRQVDLVLQCETGREQAPWVVIHSRVGCIRGISDLRYRVGLRRAVSRGYPRRHEVASEGNELPTPAGHSGQEGTANRRMDDGSNDGTEVGSEERT